MRPRHSAWLHTVRALETTLAQIIADDLGAKFDIIQVIQGDSAQVPTSTGTYASRSAVLGGGAAKHASPLLREKIKRVGPVDFKHGHMGGRGGGVARCVWIGRNRPKPRLVTSLFHRDTSFPHRDIRSVPLMLCLRHQNS
jgi:hypothetical protein